MNHGLLLVLIFLAVNPTLAQKDSTQSDSLKTYALPEVQVEITRAQLGSGVSYTALSKVQLQERNLGQDLPYLLQNTPSAVVTSDAGTGIGYTYLRIRGTDATRTSGFAERSTRK